MPKSNWCCPFPTFLLNTLQKIAQFVSKAVIAARNEPETSTYAAAPLTTVPGITAQLCKSADRDRFLANTRDIIGEKFTK